MQVQSQKMIALEFLRLAASGQVEEAFERFVGESFVHHNQYFKGDRASLLSAMKESSVTMPNKKFETKLVLEDGDKVMVYSFVQVFSADIQIAVVHIMRFKNNQIAELWDIGQQISKNSPNENGLF